MKNDKGKDPCRSCVRYKRCMERGRGICKDYIAKKARNEKRKLVFKSF